MKGECEQCHRWGELHKHHKVFRSHQGTDDESNIEKLCIFCHERIHGIKVVESNPQWSNKKGG